MPDSTVNYAFPYPVGGDRVAVHSDVENLAKSADARLYAVAQDAEAGKYYRRAITTSDTLDSLEHGAYWVPDAPEARAMGLPEEVQGSVRVISGPGSSNLRDAIYISRNSPPAMYFTTRFANGWTPWQRVAIHQPGQTRTTAFSLNHPRGMDSEAGQNRQYRVPFKLGARARLKRVAFRNYDYNSDTPGVGQVELRNVGLGLHNMNADGTMSGRFIEDSTVHALLTGTVTAPADHGTFYSNDVDLEIEPHTEYLLSYAYAADDTMTVRRQLGQCFMNTILGSWNNTSQTVTATPQNYMGLHVWLELEVDASTPVWAYIGDSQLSGLSTSRPAYDSWARVHAYSSGAIPQILAHPGGSLAGFLDPSKRALRMWDHLDKPDRIYIAGLGSNDISNGRPLTGMQEYFGTVAQNVREKFSPNLYLTTTLPRTGPNATDAVRAAYNAWLLTLPGNAIAASDHFTAVLDPRTGFMDERWQGPGGDVHLNTAGNARLAQATDVLLLPDGGKPTVTHVGDGVYEVS